MSSAARFRYAASRSCASHYKIKEGNHCVYVDTTHRLPSFISHCSLPARKVLRRTWRTSAKSSGGELFYMRVCLLIYYKFYLHKFKHFLTKYFFLRSVHFLTGSPFSYASNGIETFTNQETDNSSPNDLVL